MTPDCLPLSRPGVSLPEGATEPFAGHVSVDLCRRQRGVAEHLLNRTQVRTAFQQVRGHGVAKAMRAEVGDIIDQGQRPVDEPAHDAWIDAPPPVSHEERRTGGLGHQQVPILQPAFQGSGGRSAQRNRTLLVALAENPENPPVTIDVAEVQPAELRDPDAARIQNLNDRQVTLGSGPPTRLVGGVDPFGQLLQECADLTDFQRRREATIDPWGAQGHSRIARHPSRAVRPSEEGPYRGCPTLQRRSFRAGGMLVGQPGPQVAQFDGAQIGRADPSQMGEQAGQVTPIGPHGVRGQVAFLSEMGDEGRKSAREVIGDHGFRTFGHDHQSRRAGRAAQAATPDPSYDGGRRL